MKHEIKIEPPYLEAVLDGRKTFEIRLNDRGYNAGDTVKMTETEYPYRKLIAQIAYVTGYMQQPGYVVFSLKNVLEISE